MPFKSKARRQEECKPIKSSTAKMIKLSSPAPCYTQHMLHLCPYLSTPMNASIHLPTSRPINKSNTMLLLFLTHQKLYFLKS